MGDERKPFISGHDLNLALWGRISELGCQLCGEPNRAMSSASEQRHGRKGSLVIRLSDGSWYDHEAGIGGGPVRLVMHRLGLDYEAARKWALDWLGGAVMLPPLPPKRPDPQKNLQKSRWKVKAILERVRQILSADPADRYLRKRGLDPKLGQHCLFHLPGTPQHPHAAMVAEATDEAGNVLAIQITRLNEAGQKARVKYARISRKAAHGWTGRAAVRFPAQPEANPDILVLTEGMEDALTVHQVTGLPVAALLGIAGFIRFVPPAHIKRLILCRDGDAPDSPADLQMQRVIARLCQMPVDLRVTRPPPGRDANDLLLMDGPKAVQALIEGAEKVPGGKP